MGKPFTIRIYVPDGDPEGMRIIDRMNWTGLGIVLPREQWADKRRRDEFGHPGVYLLVGYKSDADRPTLYIGQADNLRERIDQHSKGKEFWDSAIVFRSTNNSLNRAHVLWLEAALYDKAKHADRADLDNAQIPAEPRLSESERADMQGFLDEILQILPLLGLRVLEPRVPVARPNEPVSINDAQFGLQTENDTIIVPARKDGFEQAFLGANRWQAIRISAGMRPRLKWIAAYQTAPVQAITYIAEIDRIEPYGDGWKYAVIFKGPAQKLERPIPLADAPPGYMQGIRYTTREKLLRAQKVTDIGA